jgi:hypothetical protein
MLRLLATEGDDGDDELGDADQQGDECHVRRSPWPVANALQKSGNMESLAGIFPR